jgi:hypothetical protein
MPPPITKVVQFFTKDSRTAILEETLAPPMMATKGFAGFFTSG